MSSPFTWMHELGHMFEHQDHIVTEDIDKLRSEFIAEVQQAYGKAVSGGLDEKEEFMKTYAPLIDLREDFKLDSQKPKRLEDGEIYKRLNLLKKGVRWGHFSTDFKDWTDADYRFSSGEIFADAVATLIINPKRAFQVHPGKGKKFLNRLYIKLFKHLEEKYFISLGKPKKGIKK